MRPPSAYRGASTRSARARAAPSIPRPSSCTTSTSSTPAQKATRQTTETRVARRMARCGTMNMKRGQSETSQNYKWVSITSISENCDCSGFSDNTFTASKVYFLRPPTYTYIVRAAASLRVHKSRHLVRSPRLL